MILITHVSRDTVELWSRRCLGLIFNDCPSHGISLDFLMLGRLGPCGMRELESKDMNSVKGRKGMEADRWWGMNENRSMTTSPFST